MDGLGLPRWSWYLSPVLLWLTAGLCPFGMRVATVYLEKVKVLSVMPRTGTTAAHEESPNLDFLRAIAVLAVYFVHLFITLGAKPSATLGLFGVLIFFVHTSLVLMMSLERIEQTGRPLFRVFYIRRFFRIYPLSMVCVSLVVLFHLPPHSCGAWFNPDLSTVLANLLLCTNLFYKQTVISILWTLPYEVQMYILLPVLYLAGKVYGIRGILVLWCGAVVAAIVQPQFAGRLDVVQYGPCFLAGVASYFLGFGVMRRRLPFIGWPLVIAAAEYVFAHGSALGSYTAAGWIACLMIGLTAPLFADLELPPLRKLAKWIARYSYGIYLTHPYAQWAVFVVLKDQSVWIRYVTLVALSAGLPMLFYHLLEFPMIRIGARLANRLSARAIRAAPATI